MPSRQSNRATSANDSGSWIVPADPERSFGHYLEAIWAGRWIVVVTVLAALAGAGVYVLKAQKVYEAHSQLLVTPISSGATAPQGLGLVQQSSDPLRDVETFAGFVSTTSVAQRARQSTGFQESPQALLNKIKVTPIAESDIVDIAADDASPRRAQQLANAFAIGTVADRTASLYNQLDPLITHLKAQIATLGPGNGGARAALGQQLAQLQTLRAGSDPTVRVEALANLPTSPIRPRKSLTLVAGLFGGLVAGIGLVFLIQLLDPRLRREEELRGTYRLPILTRVPRASRQLRSARHGPIAPEAQTPEAADAYGSLRSVLATSKPRDGTGRVVLVTGATPLDGKTTTAINLAASLATSDEQVMLIEGDIRRPSIGRALDISVPESVEGVLAGKFGLHEALVDIVVGTNAHAPHMRLLLANPNGASASQPVSSSAFRAMIEDARTMADWVVIDAPPLIFAPDLLTASEMIDDVILVVRLGNTHVRNLSETAEILDHHGIRPAGFVVVGTTGRPSYY